MVFSTLKIFKDIQTVFNRYIIPFWLEHGTLLGMVREGKIIDGDDDIDLAATFEPTIANIKEISSELYALGYDVFVTDVKLSIKKGKEHVSVFLYKDNVIPNHLMRYRISKKNYMAHILLYGFLEGLKTPYKDSLHNPTIKHRLINISKRIMSMLPAKEQLHDLILAFGKKIDCLFIFDIAFPREYIYWFHEIDFYGSKTNIPIQSKKYLAWMYGDDWETPNQNYEKQWDFYHDMEKYNTKRELTYNLEKVVGILNKHEIPFWMYGGALLGYVRDGKLIPWDNDIDLFVWKRDYHKILELKKEFKDAGYVCSIRDGCIMLKWNDMNITIVHYTLDGEKAWLEKLCTRNKFGNIIYYGLLCKTLEHKMKLSTKFLKWFLLKSNGAYKTRQEVPSHFYQKLKTINLLGVDLNVPEETEDYLEYTFGSDWRTPIKNFKYTPEYVKVVAGKKPTKSKYHSDSIA